MAIADARSRHRPRSLPRRLARWTGLGLLAIVGLALIAVAVFVGRVWFGQPDLDGERIVDGLDAEATIARDALGVVHIDAKSEQDAYFALGFVHAQDRFFQMDALRRIVEGRLAELAGPPMAKFDARMRRLGLGRLARGDAAVLAPDVRAVYGAYAAGVNAWLATRKGVAADELALLLAGEPEPWRIEHSLGWNRLMGMRLVGNWASELMRLRLAETLTAEQIADLWPAYPAAADITFTEVSESALAAASALAGLVNKDDGSNGWVVAADKSDSGHALLANDPHLGLTTPGIWHLVSMRAPGFRLAGASTPGAPAVILGHNGHIAWGLTNATTDTSDLYIEKPDPTDPTRYLTPDGPKAFESRTEIIPVRFGDDVKIVIRETRHGPVISDSRADAGEDTPVLALAHTGLMPEERSAETIFRVNRAKSWPEALAAAAFAKGPQQNLIYAGPDGVGMATVGLLPIRRKGDGFMPADGATGDGDWVGFADVSAMPQVFNPARGWVANANNRLAGPDYPLWLGGEWGHPGRVAEIVRGLGELQTYDLDAMAQIQQSHASPLARALLPLMLEAVDGEALDQDARALADRLRDWDGGTGIDAFEPTIFFAWLQAAMDQIFADELGEHYDGWRQIRAEPLEHVLRDRPIWCDDGATSGLETCGEALATALSAAGVWLEESYGSDPEDWRWGDAHKVRFRHMVFGFTPGLRQLFDIRLPAPGALETVNRAAFRVSSKHDPFGQVHGPGLRALYDLKDLEASRFVIGPGQSGRLFSRNRSSLAAPWRDGDYISLAPLTAAEHTLVLRPESE